jgi:hypothetical protein
VRARWLISFVILGAVNVSATVRYVNLNNSTPISPYTSWASATTNIQDAVDAANSGDQILVTNGVYQSDGRLTSDGTTNCVAVTNSVTLLSVNGAVVTSINGGHAMRCVYLVDGAVLSGFTLTNGYAADGGGAWCTSTNALLANCVIVTNSATYGGGVYSGTLSNCTVSHNSVGYSGSGGGAYNSTLINCSLSSNVTLVNGGSGAGALGCILNNCTLTANICNATGATLGGGASGSTLSNCTLSGNAAKGAGAQGGGAYDSTLYNCTLSGNYSADHGGGASACVLSNCTLSGNMVAGGGRRRGYGRYAVQLPAFG